MFFHVCVSGLANVDRVNEHQPFEALRMGRISWKPSERFDAMRATSPASRCAFSRVSRMSVPSATVPSPLSSTYRRSARRHLQNMAPCKHHLRTLNSASSPLRMSISNVRLITSLGASNLANCCGALCLLLAHSVNSRQRSKRSLSGAERKLSAGSSAPLRHVFSVKRILSDTATPTSPSFGHATPYSAFPHQVRRAVLPPEKAPPPTFRN